MNRHTQWKLVAVLTFTGVAVWWPGWTGPVVAQDRTVSEPRAFDLGNLFALDGLLSDRNGDSVPDFVNAALVLGTPASDAELRAAGEITARLGFETMAMDLPVARGADHDAPIIVIGVAGLAAAQRTPADLDIAVPDSGHGVVAVRQDAGRRWVIVAGGDDRGLDAAARTLAGVLPHTKTLSSPTLDDVRRALDSVLTEAGVTAGRVTFSEARMSAGADVIDRLIIDVTVEDRQVDTAAAALRAISSHRDAADSTLLRYPGLADLELRISAGAGVRSVVTLAAGSPPEPAGPIPGRPGSGAKQSMDLSNLFTPDGLLGDGDGNLIPDRIDAVIVPAGEGIGGVPDLAARLGLEATGLAVPLLRSADTVDDPGAAPTMILAGAGHPLVRRLADSGRVDLDALGPGEGLVRVVPNAFGQKTAMVVTGADHDGADRAIRHVAETLPYLDARGKDRPTVDDVERELWSTLAARSPAGQAATALYRLDRIVQQLNDKGLDSARVLLSVEKADPGLADIVRDRARRLGAAHLEVVIDDRDVQNAAVIFDDTLTVPGEVDRFWDVFNQRVLPGVTPGARIRVEARLSEPPEIRDLLAREARRALIDGGADPDQTSVTVLSAFKQGYSWLYEHIRPQLTAREIGEIVIRFRRNRPPAEWRQQAIHTPVRWLHEIFPIDEILARELHLPLDRIRFEMTDDGPTYAVRVTDADGATILEETFEPRWVLRPYFDRFRDYEQVRVTTGWIEAVRDGQSLVSERIVTDPEWFWDYFQATTLPAIYDYVMDRHEGKPRGGGRDAPYFGELRIELEMSEPHYLLDLDKELIAPMDAMHEELYFGTIEFFHLLGRNARGQELTYPGRIIPIMRPKGDGTPGRARIRFTGFATSRPAVVVSYRERSGSGGETRLDVPVIDMPRPSARRALLRSGEPGLARLDLRVRVDAEADERERWLTLAPAEQVDERMISAAQVLGTIANLETLRSRGLYQSTLAFPGLREIGIWAEWTHEEDTASRRTIVLEPNGVPGPLPDWRALLPEDWIYTGQRLVQWDTPIPPGEGHEVLAKMASVFGEATVYRVGESYLGTPIWAMDLMPPIAASHWSSAKATTFKPTVIYSARQHANEVSSTSHVLRHAELLLTDTLQRRKLDRVNVVVHPFTNPDGAQLAYDLYRITPELILHAGYLASLGMDATSGSDDDHPIYPEAGVRDRLWRSWLPDIFLNPHGYPSHQVVQLFSEYTGLVRRGRVTERNWGFNKGWFMPGFGYVDDPEYPRHRAAAFTIREYITRGINANRDVFAMNQRNYARYRRYGSAFDPDVFRLPMVDSVLIHMPLKGARGQVGGSGLNPKVTIWSGTTEAPDETAHGAWMQLVAKAGLSWDQAILDYLYDGDHVVERSGSTFFGGVSLTMNRPRPPRSREEHADPETATPPAEGSVRR